MKRALARLSKELAGWEDLQYPFSPATPKQLTTLRKACQQRLGASLPDGYLHLLSLVNGWSFNGYTVYAAAPRVLAGERPVELEGFVEENEGLRLDRPECSDLLVFSLGDMDSFVYRLSDGKYLAVGRVGEEVFETYKSFGRMLAAIVNRAVASNTIDRGPPRFLGGPRRVSGCVSGPAGLRRAARLSVTALPRFPSRPTRGASSSRGR